MGVLYNFHNLYEMVGYEEIYKRFMLKNFVQNVQVKQERNFLCARNLKFMSTMQHIRTIEKPQVFGRLARFSC